MTQSTLSAGIEELERLLDVQLVERDTRHVRLTAVGEDVVARGRELLAAATDLAENARSATRPLSGPLHLGAIPTIAPFLLPSVLPALRRAYAELRLHLREDLTDRLIERLHTGRLDVALIALPFETGDLYVRELFKDEFAFVAREGDPAVREKSVVLRSIERRTDGPVGGRTLPERPHPRRLRSPSRPRGTARRGHEPDHADPDGRRRPGRDAAARDHTAGGSSQGHPARRAPHLARGAFAHPGPGGPPHLAAPPRRRSPRGVPHGAPAAAEVAPASARRGVTGRSEKRPGAGAEGRSGAPAPFSV